MSYQDFPGDSLSQRGAGLTPLVGYGADSTLSTNSDSDAIPTSVTTPAGSIPPMDAPQPSGSPQHLGGSSWKPTGAASDAATDPTMSATSSDLNDMSDLEEIDQVTWSMQRTGTIAGIVVTGLAVGAGAAWFILSRRRSSQARLLAAQSRGLLKYAPQVARPRLSDAVDSGTAAADLVRQSAREASDMAIALADAAVAIAQEARARAQALLDQTSDAAQDTQGNLLEALGQARDTASTSWDTATQAARTAFEASRRTALAARVAARQTAQTARDQSARTASVARRNYGVVRGLFGN